MDWQEILIDVPARFIGQVAGELFHYLWLLAAFASAIYVGRLLYLNIAIRYLNTTAAIIVGLYLVLVLARAESFFAAGVFDAIERVGYDE